MHFSDHTHHSTSVVIHHCNYDYGYEFGDLNLSLSLHFLPLPDYYCLKRMSFSETIYIFVSFFNEYNLLESIYFMFLSINFQCITCEYLFQDQHQ